MPTNAIKTQFFALDMLRGCAAIAVVFFHAQQIFGLTWMMPSGYMAVDVFFVMSGFVIAHSYDSRIPALGVTGFIRIRFIRFFPLYVLGLAFGLCRAIGLWSVGRPVQSPTEMVIDVVSAILFIPAAFSGHYAIAPLNGPAWSLILEMWMNFFYALLFKYITPKLLIYMSLISLIIMFYYTSIDMMDQGAFADEFIFGAARICYSFPLGVLLYRYRNDLHSLRLNPYLIILIVLVLFMIPKNSIYNFIFVTIVSPIAVLLISKEETNKTISMYLGIISYCIYIIHEPFLQICGGLVHRLDFPMAFTIMSLVTTLVIVSVFLDRFYDRPARKYLASLRAPKFLKDVLTFLMLTKPRY